LRLKGRATTAAVSAALGVDAASVLEQAQAEGLCTLRTGRLSGWLLTPEGREREAELSAAERASADLSPLAAGYDTEFLALNRTFKQVCTDWQLNSDVAATAEALLRVHQTIGDLLAAYAAVLPRFAAYQPRFDAALERFRGGDTRALIQPLSDSYHDIWLELHEDLLRVLDKQREEDD
jgi:hypothetical protein